MLRKITQNAIRRTRRLPAVTNSLSRRFGWLKTNTGTKYIRFLGGYSVKDYTEEKFHKHHKKVYQRIFDKEMPEDHLHKEDFTIFEQNLKYKALRAFEVFKAAFEEPLFIFLVAVSLAIWFDEVRKNMEATHMNSKSHIPFAEAFYLIDLQNFGGEKANQNYQDFKRSLGNQFTNDEFKAIFCDSYVCCIFFSTFLNFLNWKKNEIF